MKISLYLFLFFSSFLWLFLINTLMIADVWDETNFILALQSQPFSDFTLLESIKYVWINHITIYRPLPLSMFLMIDELVGSNFVYLRYFNILILLLSLYFLSKSLIVFFKLSFDRVVIFNFIILFSSSALITGGWFANIFDALCLFFLSLSAFLLSHKKYIVSAISIGLSFFCKEISILAIPFFGFILYKKNITYKNLLVPIIIIIFLGSFYAYLRQKFIPLGSNNDIHDFDLEGYFPSVITFLKSFWFQHTKFSSSSLQGWFGLGFFILSIAAIKNHFDKLFIILIIFMATLAYWNMFGYQGNSIVNSVNFIGRLYLIPSIMVLYIMVIRVNKAILFFISLFMLSGTVLTYIDHSRFQKVYFDIYELAKKQSAPLFVHYPEKLLFDHRRKIYIGNYPDSIYYIDTDKAVLISKHFQ